MKSARNKRSDFDQLTIKTDVLSNNLSDKEREGVVSVKPQSSGKSSKRHKIDYLY